MPHVHWRAGQAGREGGSAGSPWNILEPELWGLRVSGTLAFTLVSSLFTDVDFKQLSESH